MKANDGARSWRVLRPGACFVLADTDDVDHDGIPLLHVWQKIDINMSRRLCDGEVRLFSPARAVIEVIA